MCACKSLLGFTSLLFKATVLGHCMQELKHLVLWGTQAYYDYRGVCVRFPPAQADKPPGTLSFVIVHQLCQREKQVQWKKFCMKWLCRRTNCFCLLCVLLCVSVSFCVCVCVSSSSSFFFFNFGCERYLMYQKQFVQTLFYQLKAYTPCWGPLI